MNPFTPFSEKFRKRSGLSLAGSLTLALTAIVLFTGAGNVPIQNFLPQGPMQGDLNAGGHNLTNIANINATQFNGSGVGLTNLPWTNVTGAPTNVGTYTLPPATTTTLGGVKQGSGTSIAADGTLSVTAGGSGTVTSVTFSPTPLFTVTGSPVTGAGTLTESLVAQTPKSVLAGPASGSTSLAPTFRALVSTDLPTGYAYSNLSGTPTTFTGYGLTTPLLPANNLSDLAAPATARASLGLGTAATSASSAFEPALGNPAASGYVLSSTTAGVRSWIAPATGGTYTLPPATATTLGGVKQGSGTSIAADGTLSVTAGGTGTVTSVAATVPAGFTVTGSPITGAGTLALSYATGQSANQFLATPNGTTGALALRAIAAADLPALNYLTPTGSGAGLTALPTNPALYPTLNQNTTGTAGNVTGVVALANGGTGTATTPSLVAGTNVTISGVWPNQTINSSGSGGGVISFSSGNLSPVFTASVATATTTPALSFALSAAAQNSFLAGPVSSSGAPTYRALVSADVPTLNQNTTGTAANLSGTPALPNGVTATTQSAGDNSPKLATTAYVATAVAGVSGGGGGGGFSTLVTLTSGTTWQLPAGKTAFKIRMIGGGGAGGGTTGFGTCGGGGGAGAYLEKYVTGQTALTSYSIVIGTGGTGVAAAAGANGSATTFTVGATTYTAGGGAGAPVSAGFGASGLGGTATNGDLNSIGAAGERGVGAGQAAGLTTFPGQGANTAFGAGGIYNGPPGLSGSGGPTSNGIAGSGYGSGGSGALASATGQGGNGAPGCIVIEY